MGHIFVFDGVPSTQFDMVVSGEDTWIKPAPEYERISIPGRNGDLLLPNNRFENVNVRYHCMITRNFDANYQALANHLYSSFGYRRLEDSYHPEEYRMGAVTRGLEPKMSALNRNGIFDLTFDCKPQRWLKTGEKKTITKNGSTASLYWGKIDLFNPTPRVAYPNIDLDPSRFWDPESGVVGNHLKIDIYIRDTELSQSVFSDADKYMTITTLKQGTGVSDNTMRIDSENKYVYRMSTLTNLNGDIEDISSARFPELKPGMNYLYLRFKDVEAGSYDVTNTVKPPVISPRWWLI